MLEPGQTTVIVNPAARNGEVGRHWRRLESVLTRHLGPCRFFKTQRSGHGVELAKQAVDEGSRAVLSLGGDGTHGEVVHGLMEANADPDKVAYGALPAGTGGDFCRMIEGDRELGKTAAALSQAQPTLVDVGVMRYQRDEGGEGHRHFLNIASCGANGQVVRMVNQASKRLGGALTFFQATARVWWSYSPPSVRVIVDGAEVGVFTIDSVCICNGRFAGGGMLFGPEARMSDGLLDVVIMPVVSNLDQVRRQMRFYKGTHVEMPQVTMVKGSVVKVEPVDAEAEALVECDGESPGMAPAEFSVRPGALSLLGLKPEYV